MSLCPPRCGLDSNVLNFRAKMVTTDAVDRDRVFIISFYLCDDSISVFERPQRNSGKNVRTMVHQNCSQDLSYKSMTLMVGLSDSLSILTVLKTDETDDVSCIDPLLQG